MSVPFCLTNAVHFVESAPGEESHSDGLDVRVLRGLPATDAWPVEDAARTESVVPLDAGEIEEEPRFIAGQPLLKIARPPDLQ